jgi:CheY-like chemotaxis protein
MPSGRAVRILVVNDDLAVRGVLYRTLTDAGYAVTTTDPERLKQQAIQAADAPFDLVLTNVFVPGLSVSEVVGPLQRLFPGCPILHLDSLPRPEPVAGTRSSGPWRAPFTLEGMLEAVRATVIPKE